jgi:predicted metalloendopeptidase
MLATLLLSPVVLLAQTTPATPIPGYDAAAMDKTADPCVDFAKYACGNYSKLHPIPEDMPAMDQFTNLYLVQQQYLMGILNKVSVADPARTPLEAKVGDYYAACVNTDAINKRGLKPLAAELEAINAIKSKAELPALVAHLKRMSVNALFDAGEQQDYKDATQQILSLDQGGLGLPERDYYTRTDEHSKLLRDQYAAHLAKILVLLGDSNPKATDEAKAILQFETQLAEASMGNVERREPTKVYHPMSLLALADLTPSFDFTAYLQKLGSPSVLIVNVASPEFFKGLDKTLGAASLDTLKAYLRAHLADSYASRLPKAFDEENFDFYGRKLEGTPVQRERAKRCTDATDSYLGEALGQLYVAKYFPAERRTETTKLIQEIEKQMDEDLDHLTWMTSPTRAMAREKLKHIADKIGYPNKWRDYSALTIGRDDAFGNAVRTRAFELDYQLNKIGKPVNHDEWGMTPPTVNAYYDPSMNDINFPAGILAPPFYDASALDATNYGHIGAVMGHELTHGFDDQGRKFDGAGNLKDWWQPQDGKQFEQLSKCFVDEYSDFTAVDELKVKGDLTLGENTADNGGLRLALMAYYAHAAATMTNMAMRTNGFTPSQQFFLGYAQNWCGNARPEYARELALTDPHSPDAVRINGVLSNFPEFSMAFGCKKSQPMYPTKHCRVW